jgi:superfamily II DNA helicase RecQ
VQTARYIRACTVRPNIRYLVQRCPASRLVEVAVRICRQWQRQLQGRKGVVYCRTHAQCEQVALELGCSYYHAGVDPEGRALRIASWVQVGGLIVATSALGTGVDFEGIIRVLHVGQPYGMIDFAQESGRAGRGGEAVDALILWEGPGQSSQPPASRTDWQALDQAAMSSFVRAGVGVCRRAVMSAFLDGQEVSCTALDCARCDRCGEGVTEWHAAERREAQEQATVRALLDELAGTCPRCLHAARSGCTWGRHVKTQTAPPTSRWATPSATISNIGLTAIPAFGVASRSSSAQLGKTRHYPVSGPTCLVP